MREASLADEVGLGKTIEVGLIIKELRASGLVNRTLILVPASFHLQRQSEPKLKSYLGRGGANTWMARGGKT